MQWQRREVHCDLVFPEVPEAPVCHVELQLSEDGFGFDTPSPPVPDSFFGGQQLAGLASVFLETVVDFDDATVCPGSVTKAAQRASSAVPSLVYGAFTAVSAGSFCMGGSDACHVLAHRASIVVFLCVVMEIVMMEWIGFVTRALLRSRIIVVRA